MKFPKIVALLVMLCIIVGALAGCGCEHEYTSKVTKEANCVEEGILTYTCNLCGESYTESIPKTNVHVYSSEITKEATVSETGIKTYTCSLCGDSYTETIEKIKGNWDVGYYVDDFGDKTNDSYVIGTFSGTFSNSAATGSRLTVFVYLDPDYPSITQIRLLEYGSSKATFLSSETITLKTKDSSGNTKSYTLTYSSGDLFSIDSTLRSLIVNSEELSMVITTSSIYQSIPDTYQFKVDNLGLAEILK